MRDSPDNNIDIDFESKAQYTRWLPKIDERLGSPDRWDLIVLCGYPSMWKTNFTLFMAEQNVLNDKRVCYMSLELTKKALLQRQARKYAWVDFNDWQDKNLSHLQIEKMKDKIDYYKTLMDWGLLWILWATETPTINNVESVIRECNDKGYGMVIIDNLWKIGNCATDLESQSKATSKLEDLKDELNLCIVLMHHLKKPAKWDWYSPWWSHAFSGSQKIKDNATQFVEIRRDLDPEQTVEEQKARVKLIQYKHTWDGIVGECPFYFHRWSYVDTYEDTFNFN